MPGGCRRHLEARTHSEARRSRLGESTRSHSEGWGRVSRRQETENEKLAQKIEEPVGQQSKRVRLAEEMASEGRAQCIAGRRPLE